MPKVKRLKRGMILLYTMFVIIFITILVTAVFFQMQSGMFLTKNMIGDTKAYCAALSGLEYAEAMLNKNIYWPMNISDGDNIGAYEITINNTGKEIEVNGLNTDTEDSFKMLFSFKINTTIKSGIERKSLERSDPKSPYSFNNMWYMMSHPSSLNKFSGKEVAVCDTPVHNIFISPGAEIYVSVQGKSRNKVCNLEKIFRIEANQNIYPAAIYARNIDIAVREKFLINQTAGRHPAVICKNRFNLTMQDVPGASPTVDPNVFNNLGGMPFFLQDGVVYTNNDITINGNNFASDDSTLSEKYRVRLEPFRNFMERKFPAPIPSGEGISSNVLTAIKIPGIYKKIRSANTLGEVNALLSPSYTPPPDEQAEYAILVGDSTIPADNFDEEVDRVMTDAALLEFYEKYYDEITSHPESHTKEEIEDIKHKKDELAAKAHSRTIDPSGDNVYALKEKGVGPSLQDLQVVENNFDISGYTIEMKGNVNCNGDIVIRGGSSSASGYVLSYAYDLGSGGVLSASGTITIEGGVRGSGTILANNIKIKGPLKLNDEPTTYTNLFAFQNLTIDYKQEAAEFEAEDISPAWVAANFMLAYFLKKPYSNFDSFNSSEILSADETIRDMLDNFTLEEVIKIQDFPMDAALRRDCLQKSLREILLESYYYNSANGNNSPEGLVRALYTTFIKNNLLDIKGVYSFFNIDPKVFSHTSFSDNVICPPTQATSLMNITPSSNIRGFLYSGKDMMINIESGDFSVEGTIMCGETLTESGLDNFIVRYDPSFSTLNLNPSSADYRVSEVYFGRF